MLQAFYDRRRELQFDPKPDMFPIEIAPIDLFHICEQLGENGLLDWRGSQAIGAKIRSGFGKITARGIDVVEGEATTSLKVTLMNQTVNIHGSTNVIVGDGNRQEIGNHIHALAKAIDASNGTPEEKAEAKGRLASFIAHPLVAAIAGGAVTLLSGPQSHG